MERNRDLRRATLSAVNGLSRRRQRIITLRDSTDQDRQMDLQEMDRQQLQKEREREFPKRRRVGGSMVQQRNDGGECYRENETTDSSDEEYYNEEVETRIHQQNRTNQLSQGSCSLSNNRRGLRTLRSTPVLRAAADEMFGTPIPRRARSYSAKRLHEYWNSGSGGEDFSHRRSSLANVCLIGPGVSMKKIMKPLKRRTSVLSSTSNPKLSVIGDDIEIEVAEALFDLMKQSQSQSRSSLRQEKVDTDIINTAGNELNMLNADGGKDKNNAFSVQNESSVKINPDLSLADSVKEMKREGRIENESKFPDDPAQELVNEDGFVNKVKVGSPKESESPSCVKVNVCDIQDPTVTKAHFEAIITEAKKENKLEIDLMALPPLPSSPEKDAFDKGTDPEVITQVGQKKSETISKDGHLAVAIGTQEEKARVVNCNQLSMKMHRHDGIFSVSSGASQPQQGRKELKNQSPTSLLPFPIGTSGLPGVLPHPGYMPPPQAVLPTSGNAKPSIIMQPPQFKFSQPRTMRCATHKFLAHSIHCHQELIKKSLSSGSTGPAALYRTKYSNLKYMLPPTQNLTPGNPLVGDYLGGQNLATVGDGSVKDENFDASDTTYGKSVLQQASHVASASNFLRGPGFIFPLGHHQTTMMAPANSSGQSASVAGNASLPSNSAGRCSVNLPLPTASAAMSLNHPPFSSNEAAQYMAILQNNGCPFPTTTNIVMPPFKGGTPSVPFVNPSLSPMFNVSQNQQQLAIPHTRVQSASQTANSSSHKHPQCQKQASGKISDNKFPIPVTVNPQQSEKSLQLSYLSSKFDTNQKSRTSVANGLASHSVKHSNSQTSSLSAPPMNLAMNSPVSVGSGGVCNKHIDAPQQGSKDRVGLIPQAFALSFGSSASAAPTLSFSSMAQNAAMFHMLPDVSWNGNQMVNQNFQASEGKSVTTGGQSFNFSKSGKEMSALSAMEPPKFDGLARTINFLPSSLTGNQPFQTSSAALSSGFSVTIPNSQQHQHQHQPQLIQVQNPQMMQWQLAGTAQVKSSTPNSISGSFLASIFPSNNPVFMQVSVPNDNSSSPLKCENFPKTSVSEGSSQSATSGLVNLPQLRSSHNQTHMTFGNSPISAASCQGHKIVAKSEPTSSLMVGLSSDSSILRNKGISQRTVPAVGTAASTISTIPSQEAEASPGGISQKSSPSCRWNMPSILSTCPSQLPDRSSAAI